MAFVRRKSGENPSRNDRKQSAQRQADGLKCNAENIHNAPFAGVPARAGILSRLLYRITT